MTVDKVIVGDCTLYRGDALEVLPALAVGSVDAVIADPPYSSGALHIGGRQKSTSDKYTSPTMGHWSQEKEYPTYCGDNCDQMTWILFARSWLMECYRVAKEGAHLYVFCDWRQLGAAILAMQMAFWQYRGIVIWDKGNTARAPLAGLWRHGAEFLLWGAKDRPWSVTNGEWLPGVAPIHNVLAIGNVREKEHVTQKPVALLEVVLNTCCPRGGTILDPFSGSATTGVACLQTGRKFIGIEIDPHYFEVGCRRIRETNGDTGLYASARTDLDLFAEEDPP